MPLHCGSTPSPLQKTPHWPAARAHSRSLSPALCSSHWGQTVSISILQIQIYAHMPPYNVERGLDRHRRLHSNARRECAIIIIREHAWRRGLDRQHRSYQVLATAAQGQQRKIAPLDSTTIQREAPETCYSPDPCSAQARGQLRTQVATTD